MTPFLTTIVPSASIKNLNKAKTRQPIKNYETLTFKHHNNITSVIDEGYYILDKGIQNSAYWVKVQFQASKTKHAQYIYQATIQAFFDDFVIFKINEVQRTKYNPPLSSYYNKGLITYENMKLTDSSLNLYAYVIDDDDGWDKLNMSCNIFVTLYYK